MLEVEEDETEEELRELEMELAVELVSIAGSLQAERVNKSSVNTGRTLRMKRFGFMNIPP